MEDPLQQQEQQHQQSNVIAFVLPWLQVRTALASVTSSWRAAIEASLATERVIGESALCRRLPLWLI